MAHIDTSSNLFTCPMCEEPAVEPVRLEGALWCAQHVSRCMCGAPALPGDEACTECLKMIRVAPAGELPIAS
ncbi:Uncharacterised protein [Mycobacteroides abscessus subsp. abscessus]|nr:Uncharacterised protein [Mycobacteroides abscessus subsp. abscessus]